MSREPLFVEESHDLPLVHFQIVVQTGSTEDPVGHEGLTRLSARSLRRGTQKRDTRAIEDTIDALGAELSIDTAPSQIRLSGSCIKRSLEPTMALVGELLNEPSFPEQELSQLKRETLAALLELTDSDQLLASMHLRRSLFRGHPYGRPSLGTRSTLGRIDLGQVRARYEQGIALAPRVVGFAGAVGEREAEQLVKKYIARSGKSGDASVVAPEPAPTQGRHLRIIDKAERTQTQILIGRIASHPRDPDHVALLVGNAVFGGAFTARLMRAVRSERGWSYGASSRVGLDRVREAWSMHTFPAATDAAACVELQLSLMKDWVGQGIDDSELAFAKSYLVKSHAFSIDTADKRLEQAMDVLLLDLPKDYYSGFTQHVEAVSRDDVNVALQKRLSVDDLVFSVVATESELGDALRTASGAQTSEVVPYDIDAQESA